MTQATENYHNQLRTLASSVQARRILEIGGGPEGVSGSAFCRALGEKGHLWTVDIKPTHPPQTVMDEVQAETKATWHRVVGDSMTVEVPELDGKLIDLLYIDGEHDHAHAITDYKRFAHLVRPGGLIIFDDWPLAGGVQAAVRDVTLWRGDAGVAMAYDHHNGNSHYVFQVTNGAA